MSGLRTFLGSVGAVSSAARRLRGAVEHTLAIELPDSQHNGQQNGVGGPFALDDGGAEHEQTGRDVDAVDVQARGQGVVNHLGMEAEAAGRDTLRAKAGNERRKEGGWSQEKCRGCQRATCTKLEDGEAAEPRLNPDRT